MSEHRRYLIVGPSWVGDMVMAQSLFISLKKKFPDCSIDVLAPAWSMPIIKRMPEVNTGIKDETHHGELGLRKRYAQGKQLRAAGYTHAIVIPRSWKSALVPFIAKVPIRTGYKGEQRYGLLNDIRPLNKSLLMQTVQRYVALGEDYPASVAPEIPFPVLKTDIENRKALLTRLGLSDDKKIICIMPGAEYGPAKQWPVSYYAELAGRLIDAGKQVWLLGSDKEKILGDMISQERSQIINLCGKTNLVDVVDLVSCAEQVVSNDSGLMHVAAAVGVKVNAIYGSSTPAYTPPLTSEELKKVIYLGLSCSPCFKRVCPLGHTNCLNKISSQMVYDGIVSRN
jgi:heptosyltransferase II